MSTPLIKFRLYAPEFGKLTNEQVQEFLDDAADDVPPSIFGTDADRATAHLAAHELEGIARGESSPAGWGATGSVKSVTNETTAMTFSEGKADIDSHADDELKQTRHGLKFLAIRERRSGVGPFVSR